MAWEDILRSVFKAARILGLDIKEQDLPEYGDYNSLVVLDKELWNRVKGQKGRIRIGGGNGKAKAKANL